jgi:hypothetical protein
MAVAACFAGPLFSILDVVLVVVTLRLFLQFIVVSFTDVCTDMLVGLGASLLFKGVRMYPKPYEAELHFQMYIAFAFLFVSLLSSVIVVPLSRYHIGRKYGIYLILLNLTFSAVSLTLEFTHVDVAVPRFFA